MSKRVINSALKATRKKKVKTASGHVKKERVRCSWSNSHPLYQDYHDNEWGRPVHDDNKLFEMISLEGAQSGLNWLTILKKREGYRKVFKNFDIDLVAKMSEVEIAKAVVDPSIIRHRGKIQSVVNNAQLVQEIQVEYGSFSEFVWKFRPQSNTKSENSHMNTKSSESEAISKELKKRGFKFVGPTTCYAFFQAIGLVNDHSPSCFLYEG